MSTSIDLTPQTTRVSHVSSSFNDNGENRRMLPNQQPWETSPNDPKPKETLSCEKHCTTKLFMSFFVGLVICGIPLAVIASLYGQKLATPSNGNNSNSNSNNLPTQCSTYVTNSDPTRLTTSFTCTSCICDNNVVTFPQNWYRFIEGAGTRLASSPSTTGACGASYPSYYNGTYPTTVGATTTGTICVHVSGNLCHSSYIMTISVTLCNGFYVFYLAPTSTCLIRYCTTF